MDTVLEEARHGTVCPNVRALRVASPSQFFETIDGHFLHPRHDPTRLLYLTRGIDFLCVLYSCLSRRQPYFGHSVESSASAVLADCGQSIPAIDACGVSPGIQRVVLQFAVRVE